MLQKAALLLTSEDNLAGDKDKQHRARADHAVDERGEKVRIVGTELSVHVRQLVQADGKLDVHRRDDVLYLELGELGLRNIDDIEELN